MNTEQGPDEGLLRQAVVAGDEGAWRVLYDRHFDALYRYVRSRCGNTARAEDVVQEVWLTAVRRIGRFDPRQGAFGGWLTGIADRTLRNHRRRWRRRDGTELAVTHDAADGGNGLPDTRDLISVVMAGLPERYRRVLMEKYGAQRSVAEIATASGESEKAVESLLGRARVAFRREFERHEADT